MGTGQLVVAQVLLDIMGALRAELVVESLILISKII